MGGAASLTHFLPPKDLDNPKITHDYELFAFDVIHYDWNHGALALEQKVEPTTNENMEAVLNSLSNPDLYDRIEKMMKSCYEERDLPFIDCRCPAVIHYKLSKMAEEEIKAFNHTVLEAAIQYDKKLHKNDHKASTAEDYAKSFGGTAEDTKNEKDAAELMRGTSDKGHSEDNDLTTNPALMAPLCQYPSEHQLLRRVGKWIKFLSKSGCYVYFHTLLKEYVALKPEDYVEEASDVHEMKEEMTEDVSNGLPKVEFQHLPEEIDRIVNELKKTPLIIDTSETSVARTFYSYKAELEDVSCLTIPFGKTGIKKEEVMERCRKKVVAAMKTGKLFVLYLGGVTIEHADFKTKLCKKEVFPKEVFIQGGLKLLQPDYDPVYKKIYREEDLEAGQAIARDGFQTAVITTINPFEYEKQLADSIPLGYMYPIFLVPNTEE